MSTLAVTTAAYASPMLFGDDDKGAVIESAIQHDEVLARSQQLAPVLEMPEPQVYDIEAEQLKLARAAELNAKTQEAQIRSAKQLKPKQLSRLLTMVGFEGDAHEIAWLIVMRESTARPGAHNGNSATGDDSYGLFQINMYGSLGPARVKKFGLDEEADLFDPMVNAQVAYHMSNKGRDFGAWGFGPNAYKYVPESALNKFRDMYPGETG